MHELIIEAAKSGDIEKLRPLIGTGDDATQLSLGGIEGDPIEFLQGTVGRQGRPGNPRHPGGGAQRRLSFISTPARRTSSTSGRISSPSRSTSSTPRQRVELFKIVTAGDYEDMKTYGTYIFYRVGITPEGRWAFFVAGD